MNVKLLFWLLLFYLAVSLPVVLAWYGVRVQRLLRRTRSATARVKVWFRAALGRRLRRLLAEGDGSVGGEESPSSRSLRPLP